MSKIQACVTCKGEWTNDGGCHMYMGPTITKGFMITRGISYKDLIQKIMARIDLGCKEEDLRLFHRRPGNNWMLPCAITKDCDIGDLFDNYDDLGFAPIFITMDVNVDVNVVQRKISPRKRKTLDSAELSPPGVELGCVTDVEEYSIGGQPLELASLHVDTPMEERTVVENNGGGLTEWNNDAYDFTELESDDEDDEGGSDGDTGPTEPSPKVVPETIAPSNLKGDNTGLKVGSSIFPSRMHFDETVINAAIETGYIYRSERCNKTIRYWHCKDKTCQWRARATKMWDSDKWELKSYVGVHTCTLGEKSTDHYNCTSTYIAWLLRDKFVNKVNAPNPKAIAEYCRTVLKQNISKYKAWDAYRKGIGGDSSKKCNDIPTHVPLVKQDLKVKRKYNCTRCHKSGHTKRRCRGRYDAVVDSLC